MILYILRFFSKIMYIITCSVLGLMCIMHVFYVFALYLFSTVEHILHGKALKNKIMIISTAILF